MEILIQKNFYLVKILYFIYYGYNKNTKQAAFFISSNIIPMKQILSTLIILFAILIFACNKDDDPIVPDDNNNTPTDTIPTDTTTQDTTTVDPNPIDTLPPYLKYLAPHAQRSGDPAKGKEYLLYGNYLGSGIPVDLFKTLFKGDGNALNRTGDNADIPHDYTLVDASNGLRVAVPNCMTCHGAFINGEYVLGLGNTTTDYSADQASFMDLAETTVKNLYGENSAEWEAFELLHRGSSAIAPYIQTELRGPNPANQILAALVAHRDPNTLEWNEDGKPNLTIPDYVMATDVPAWWLLKKKNTMFASGLGKGDFGRISIASNLLTMTNAEEAKVVDENFSDVMAFINTLEPPAYPETIDQNLAAEGLKVFSKHCQTCHGTYGENEFYPNLLVDIDYIGTDPNHMEVYYKDGKDYVDWYNRSWFGTTEPGSAFFEAERGYIAPPLDGIWATAPYLHNASIPTLADLLESSKRPTYWRRTFETDDYDFDKVGWNYTTEAAPDSRGQVFNTTLEGKGNQGHYFGDALTVEERKAVIEYLKTL